MMEILSLLIAGLTGKTLLMIADECPFKALQNVWQAIQPYAQHLTDAHFRLVQAILMTAQAILFAGQWIFARMDLLLLIVQEAL